MTDKQIIDGCDVSGCEFLIISEDKQMCRCIKADLFGGIEFVENAKNGSCQNNANCYYKNWKRKEQECEELKQFLSKEPLAIQALQTGYADYKKRSEVFFEMIKQYKQALREIEEITKPQPYYIDLNQNKTPTELEYDYANRLWSLEQKMYKIRQKISEVLDDTSNR